MGTRNYEVISEGVLLSVCFVLESGFALFHFENTVLLQPERHHIKQLRRQIPLRPSDTSPKTGEEYAAHDLNPCYPRLIAVGIVEPSALTALCALEPAPARQSKSSFTLLSLTRSFPLSAYLKYILLIFSNSIVVSLSCPG